MAIPMTDDKEHKLELEIDTAVEAIPEINSTPIDAEFNLAAQELAEVSDGFAEDFLYHIKPNSRRNERIISFCLVYAADRFESSAEIKKYLDQDYVVVLDRYVSANQIHQGGKIKNLKKRASFLEWLDEMEYGVFKIPRPDIILYLSLPLKFVEVLLKERNKKSVRAYAGNKKDVHETDVEFKKNSIKSALWLAKTQKGWVKIDCTKNGKIDTRENIHEKIYEEVKVILKK